jgi:ATP-binding cassette subfamily B protein
LFGPIILFGRKVRKLSRDSQDRIADVGANVSEVLGAMKIVQAFGQESREEGRFADTVERAFATARTRMRLRAVMTVVLIALFFGAIVLVIWQGALDVAAGRMTGGEIAAFVFTGVLVGGAFAALSEVYGDLLRGSGAAGRIAELIAARAEISAPAQPACTTTARPRCPRLRRRRVPLSHTARRQGAKWPDTCRRSRRDCGGGGAFRCGQVDPLPAGTALLRSAGRPRDLRWRRPARRRPVGHP